MAAQTATDYKRGIGVFKTRRETEQALYKLRDEGIDLKQVSVIAPDSDPVSTDAEVELHTHSEGNQADTGAISGAVAGGTLGTLAGLLVGLGALAIPGVGPILLAGAEATALATTLAGTAIGATSGGIIGALVGLGVPEDQAKVYNDRLSDGQYIVIVTGKPETLDRVENILGKHGIDEWHVYDALQVDVTPMTDNLVSPTALEHEGRKTAEMEAHATPQTVPSPNVHDHEAIEREKVAAHPEVIVVDARDEKQKQL
ncbi:MAG: general stress protein [Cyanobacteriota bacterium]|nr:general stress protein [Cyanobacteriota bacterium]